MLSPWARTAAILAVWPLFNFFLCALSPPPPPCRFFCFGALCDITPLLFPPLYPSIGMHQDSSQLVVSPIFSNRVFFFPPFFTSLMSPQLILCWFSKPKAVPFIPSSVELVSLANYGWPCRLSLCSFGWFDSRIFIFFSAPCSTHLDGLP